MAHLCCNSIDPGANQETCLWLVSEGISREEAEAMGGGPDFKAVREAARLVYLLLLLIGEQVFPVGAASSLLQGESLASGSSGIPQSFSTRAAELFNLMG